LRTRPVLTELADRPGLKRHPGCIRGFERKSGYGFSVEPRFGIDRIVLDKDALDRVKGRELGCVADLVKVVYNGAIKLPEKSILATGIFGDWHSGRIAIR
jgi:hypothetical protein